MNRHTTIYFAAPLFTHAERLWNAQVTRCLRARGHDVILPQEADAEMLAERGKFDGPFLFQKAIDGLERCSVVIAILDGADPDSGTAWECGYASKLGRPIIGVRTDFRPGGEADPERPVNLMLGQSCVEFVVAGPASVDCAALVQQIECALARIEKGS